MAHNSNASDETRLVEYAERIFAPLVREGVFENFERAFRALLLEYIERQISTYKQRVAEFEARRQETFEAYTDSLKDHASPEDEEAWMDWETARVVLGKWQRIYAQVAGDGSAG